MTQDIPERKTPLVGIDLPKAEMHIHGSLAASHEIFLYRQQKGRTDVSIDFLFNPKLRYYENLETFHATYERIRKITRDQYELAQVIQSYCERVFKEGGIYIELSNSFRNASDFDWQMEAIEEGMNAALANFPGGAASVVVTGLRSDGINGTLAGPEHAKEAAEYLARRSFKKVKGFGVVGPENGDSMADYADAFDIAWNKAGLGLVPHVAEQFLHNFLDVLPALPKESLNPAENDHRRLRFGHATLAHMSTEVMHMIADMGICIEICLSANKRIGLPLETRTLEVGDEIKGRTSDKIIALDRPLRRYFNDITQHPLTIFIKAGIKVCLGSDNPLLMNTNIGKEYSLAVKAGLQEMDTLQLTENAIRFANTSADTRKRLLTMIDHYRADVAAGRRPSRTVLGYQYAYNHF